MRDIDERGMRAVMEEAIKRATSGTAGLHVSFDLDGIDPDYAPGVGTPSPGGISYREAHLAMEMLADTGKVLSAELVEVNPILDQHNNTAKLGSSCSARCSGRRSCREASGSFGFATWGSRAPAECKDPAQLSSGFTLLRTYHPWGRSSQGSLVIS